MKYLKFIICLVILFPISVNGAACDNANKVRLQKIAQNITTNYDYIETNGSVTFQINFYNLNSEIYLVDTRNNAKYYSDNVLSLNGFENDKNYKFEVRSSNVLCDSSVLYYLYVATPAYNPYYNDPICENISYKYCNKWQKNTLTYDEFVKSVSEFKNSKNETIDKVEVKGIFDIILDFYIKNYYIILPLIIVVITIFIIVKSIIDKRKNSLF